MRNLTENLCNTLASLPKEEVTVHGARLVRHVWAHAPKAAKPFLPGTNATAPGALTASSFAQGRLPVETAAFNNAFQFAEHFADKGSGWCCLAVPVLSATALAEARGIGCDSLLHAVGLGIEAYSRLRASLGGSAERKSIDGNVLAATIAAIVACGNIERLPAKELAQALGLGSSAITAIANGYLPLQAATAARDGIVMVELIRAGFIGPLDPLACRWGVYEVFADAECARALDLGTQTIHANAELERLLGRSTAADEEFYRAGGSMSVAAFLAGLGFARQ